MTITNARLSLDAPSPASANVPSRFAGTTISATALQRAVLWLTVFGSCVAFIEPSPFEVMFALLAITFLATRLRFHKLLIPLIALVALYNMGGLISLVPFTNDPKAVMFILISIYMAIAAIVFAAIMLDDTEARMRVVESAWIAAAVIVSITGILGYFNIAGLGSIFSFNQRASGTFKDPNVLGTYLTFPFICLVMGFVLGNRGNTVLRAIAFLIVAAAIFLSFSRGAWALAVLGSGLCITIAFVTSQSTMQRARIIAMSLLGLGAVILLLMLVLSIPDVRELFLQRASFSQSYDSESGGRFDNQARSLPMLLSLPNGFGPYQFRYHFPEDPHNVYINAFASYGWIGGLSYLGLTLVTLIVGWRAAFMRSRYQPMAIAAWTTLFMLILQGYQIDTDHWRHYYILLGIVWGLHTAIMLDRRRSTA